MEFLSKRRHIRTLKKKKSSLRSKAEGWGYLLFRELWLSTCIGAPPRSLPGPAASREATQHCKSKAAES